MNNKTTILFVEDNPNILEMMDMVLQDFGYNVVPAKMPKLALNLFQKESSSFDLVITDFMMPEMDGEVLSNELRKIRSDIPIILCSGSDMMIDDIPHRARVNHFVSKPYDLEEFKSVIEQVLEEQTEL